MDMDTIPRKVKKKIDNNTGKWHFVRGYMDSKWGRERVAKDIKSWGQRGYGVEVRKENNLLNTYVFFKDMKEMGEFCKYFFNGV
jgi:hypothetical protein